ncbi:MAG: hypothetical protein KDD10_10590 [Phaeodactylibacter sp.]|nr:hypothetical protein [Phaeodactylibacter sp.]MCB9297142.1 hypothetical protein [Lewinellaceae bacterium]
MNRTLLALSAALFFCFHAGAQPLALASANSTRTFKVVKNSGDIHVYERWFEVEGEDRETRELKSEFTVSAGTDEVLSLIQDPEKVVKWMKAVGEVKAIGHKGGGQWLAYIRYDVPWPLNDQDCLMQYQIVRDGSRTLVYFRSVTDSRVPAKGGVKRLEGIQGLWRLHPLGDGRTKVSYSMLTLEKPTMPRWVTDPVVRANMLDSMVAFNELLKE